MSGHVTADEVRRFCEGRLQAVDVLRVARNRSDCPSCAAHRTSEGESGLDGVALSFRAAVLGESSHLDPDEDLFPWMDGTLDPVRGDEVAEHLEVCERCRDDVAAASGESQEPHGNRWFPLAIAAAFFLVIFAGLIAIVLRNPVKVGGAQNSSATATTSLHRGLHPPPVLHAVDPRVTAAIRRAHIDLPAPLADLRSH